MLTFPAGLRPISGGFAPLAKTLSGGQSLSGIEQVVSTMSDRWGASFTFPVRSDDDVLSVRRLLISSRGRATVILLPAFDLARAPWSKDQYGRPLTPGAVRRLARAPQLDGTIFADDPAIIRDGLIEIRASAAYAGATVLRLNVVKGSAPLAGHMFSIGTRLYAIEDVAGIPGVPGSFDCGVWPWVREDVAALSIANFTSPVCQMRFASDAEGVDALRNLDLLRFGRITLNFDEAP